MAACVNCGSEVPEGARICPVCNYPQDEAQAPAQPEAQVPAQPEAPQPQVHSPLPQAPPAYPAGTVAAPPTDGQAITALVLGIVGLVACPIIPSIIALILGRQSERRIQAGGGTIGGEGLAKAGWILGLIGLILWGFVILIWLVIAAIAVFTASTVVQFDPSQITPSPVP